MILVDVATRSAMLPFPCVEQVRTRRGELRDANACSPVHWPGWMPMPVAQYIGRDTWPMLDEFSDFRNEAWTENARTRSILGGFYGRRADPHVPHSQHVFAVPVGDLTPEHVRRHGTTPRSLCECWVRGPLPQASGTVPCTS